MQKTLFIVSIFLLVTSCREIQQRTDIEKDILFFKALIYPAFIEGAEVTLSTVDNDRKIDFLLKEISRDDRVSDTFYYKTITLSKNQFDSLNSTLIQKTFIRDSDKPKGIRDGIHVDFMMIHNSDTSYLALDNPSIGIVSSGYQITKNAFDNFRRIFNDTIINDYLDDAESYIDNSKTGIRRSDNRPINKLREIEYSR
jgi:hypothetical protein